MTNNDNNQNRMPQGGRPQQGNTPVPKIAQGVRMPSQGQQGQARPNGVTGARGAQGAGKAAPQGRPMSPRDAAAGVVQAAQAAGTKRTVIVVAGCVLVALALWMLIWLFACGGILMDPNAQTGQAPYKSAEEVQAELDRQVEEGMFNISIASVIQFENGTAPGTAYIENVPGNKYNMQVTITDDTTEDVLYQSGVLKPNQFIEDIVLTKDMGAGTYNATATFTALDPNTNEEVGQAAAKITLNVLG